MAMQIVVPELGESITEATVARWLKQQGEAVKVGEAVVVLETDKVDLEVGAEKDGVLAKIERQEGEDVQIGDVLGVIDESASAGTSAPAPTPEQAAPPKAEQIAAQQEKPPAQGNGSARPESAPAPEVDGDVAVTPVGKRMAEERQVDLAKVEPSGTSGRITKSDVERYLESQPAAPAASTARATQTVPLVAGSPGHEATFTTPPKPAAPTSAATPSPNGNAQREERVKMSRRRRTIAQRLVEAQHTAAMLTTFNEIDMTAVMDLRERRKEMFKKKFEIGLGLSSFFIKASIGALKEFPRLNAEIQGDEIVLKHYYDIGVAIGAEEGLVVPVLRDAERMSFAQIEKAIKDFAARSQANTLTLEDLRGGTFTVTNGGVFGSMLSTPIINAPQVGILGLHKIEDRPIALNGQVVIRQMMYVALSYDHRIVDGREAVQFLVRVKQLVEEPETLLIEG
ncbi:MAG: 2-oxoglutarate dehydrogenase complex dihydrolipoyllysine-residue succinyltransferase [Burkholderiales bacterium]|nr:2-oxoglutarate dehydrogenase complex dihydrolipoyllysine-residue succinyltransferase [Anaerolineae bacterium]